MKKDLHHPLLRSRLAVLALFLLLAPHAGSASEPSTQLAPDFGLADLSGTLHRLSAYRGKVVVLNFWATWCPDCVRELPSLNALARANREVVVLAIASDRDPGSVQRFVAPLALEYPVLVDSTGDVFVKKYLVRTLPTTVIVGRDGVIAERLYGAVDFMSRRFQAKLNHLGEHAR